jgi:hypothetical protein
MSDVSDRPSVSVVRWVARILSVLIGFVGLWGVLEAIQFNLGHLSQVTLPGSLVWGGFVLVFAGCAVGWFKEFLASLLILGGTVLLGAISLLAPSAFRGLHFLSIPAVLGFLFLYVHLASKKR